MLLIYASNRLINLYYKTSIIFAEIIKTQRIKTNITLQHSPAVNCDNMGKKTWKDMAFEAIFQLKNRNGSSLKAIRSYINTHFKANNQVSSSFYEVKYTNIRNTLFRDCFHICLYFLIST